MTDPALLAFGLYLLAVFVLAWGSHRVRRGKRFVSEYFLGSRSFGTWAFALTFAATTASGGTFMGFPSLIYTHGWVLALWIASYMVVPLVGMGLLGKRMNTVARRAGALTIPELIEERFASRGVGTLAILLVVFFMYFYLLAQFKAGSKILTTLLADVDAFQAGVAGVGRLTEGLPWIGQADPAYLLCLLLFATATIVYVAYGGFRAVVWTDVMQGVVMFVGVVLMLVLCLHQVGGLGAATRELARMTPPEFGTAVLRVESAPTTETTIPAGTWFADPDGWPVKTTDPTVIAAGSETSAVVRVLRLTSRPPPDRLKNPEGGNTPAATAEMQSVEPYAFGAGQTGVYTSAPGPSRDGRLGFLSWGMAFSFFVFWAFGTAGQPSNMVRLMAFKDTRTLRRSMVTVTVYFSVIYFSLVIIFCCARVLLPGMDDDSDRIMPELARHLTAAAGWPWLAGLLMAAPFAAVMSSVDSFLLMVSSSLVRDIYQRRLNPQASEQRIRRWAHFVTAGVGVAAVLAVLNPPRYLQDLIVFASGGLAGCFLVPVCLALYWPRLNAAGMIAGMLSGFGMHLGLTLYGFHANGSFAAPNLLGLQPFVWDLLASGLGAAAIALSSPPPPQSIKDRYFGGN